ncbi:MAG: B12-binding domain-containing radical SAM protein [Proteobacteria bacterium]|nr:B12-binding domain-containing radical SAM protein [Pseudomonadota bacterium]
MLINLVSIHPYPSPQSIPLANAFLKAYAINSAVPINLIDFFLEDDAAVCALALTTPAPVAIGFSMYVWNHDLSCEIATLLRRIQPDIKLFCGGPEVTADPKSVLNLGIFDFVITGEGEVPFLSLCQALKESGNYSKIPGVLLPDSSILPPPPPVTNLDTIPSPYLTGIIDTHSNPGILWQLSRGCSFTCDFCFDSRGIHGVRHFSLERIKSELQHFAATGVSQIFVLDSTFNLNPDRAKNILKMIKIHAPNIHFHFEVRNELIDREMAELFAQIACSLQIGLQSADREVLKLVGRSFNKTEFTAKVGLLNKSGAVFGFDLIYGLPGDTLDGFRRSLNYALSLYPNHLDIFPLAVLPGTTLASNGKSLNLCWNPNPPYILESTDSFSTADMAIAAELANACDIFYTRGKAVAWFNAIVAILSLKPSDLLQKFSHWLIDHRGHATKEFDFSDDDIDEMQHFFLRWLFSNKKVNRFLPLVLDLVNYHHLYAAALLAPLPEPGKDSHIPGNVGNVRFRLDPSATLVNFTYEITELLDCGEPQIHWMYDNFSQSGSHAVIYRNDGMVYTESLDAAYILLLEQIRDRDGKINIPETGLTKDEIHDFLEFALQEKFLVKI